MTVLSSARPFPARTVGLLTVVFLLATALYARPLLFPVLNQDDFQILAQSWTWQKTIEGVWIPNNEHAMPLGRLTTWLLKETDGWSSARVAGMKESGVSQIVRLKRAVPLHWVYITAWATEDGAVHFRRDLYGKDQAFGVSKTASAY